MNKWERHLSGDIRFKIQWGSSSDQLCAQLADSIVGVSDLDRYAFCRILQRYGTLKDSNLVVKTVRFNDLVLLKRVSLECPALNLPEERLFEYYMHSVLKFPYKYEMETLQNPQYTGIVPYYVTIKDAGGMAKILDSRRDDHPQGAEITVIRLRFQPAA